ncbi:nuclear transport factor 2 family protein [Massilia suwonensis]|uniref:Nuclear transport factor 2 family protein n=1 Tax=Massilia suwonensis TaxID=648895 RepID=A0ABW0ML54_9BURK
MNETFIRQACTDLIVRYAYLNDERRFDELAALFTDDAVLYRPSAPQQGIAGRAAILEAFRKRPLETITFHVTSDILVEVQDGETAQAQSRILLLSAARPLEAGALPSEQKPAVPGVFRDRFRLTPQGWQFAERRGMFWI